MSALPQPSRKSITERHMSIYKPSLIEKALRIATVAHKDMVRKADGLPYILHPFAVAMRLQKEGFSDDVVAAGLVHDVLEDTDYPAEQLRKELGNKVYKMVLSVTNDDTLPWEEKKTKYIETVRRGSEGAKAVALADKLHNLESLFIIYDKEGPAVWKKFNKGVEAKLWFEESVLKMLKETWDHPMVGEYERQLKKLRKLVNNKSR